MNLSSRSLLIGLGLAALAGPVHAEEIVLGLNQSLRYDSNVFRTERDVLSSAIYNVESSLRVRQRNDTLSYEVRYVPSFEVYTGTDRLDGWEHLGTAFASYRFSQAASASLTARASRRKVNSAVARGDSQAGSSLLRSGLGFMTNYQVSLGSQYYFTPRLLGDLNVAYYQGEYTKSSGIDNRSSRGELRLDYQWTNRLAIGLGGTASYTSFEPLLTRSPAQTASFNANARVRFEIDSNTELSLSGGPSLIRNHRTVAEQSLSVPRYSVRIDPRTGALSAALLDATCALIDGAPALFGCATFLDAAPLGSNVLSQKTVFYDPGKEPVASTQSLLTFFAEATLTKTLQKTTLSLSYVRREDSSSGDGRTTIRDSVSLQMTRRLSTTWTVGITGTWQAYSSTAPVYQSVIRAGLSGIPSSPGGPVFAEADGLLAVSLANDYRTTQYNVASSISKRFSENFSARGAFYFVDQSTSQSFGGVRTQRTYLATLSLRYEFDPIRF